MDKSEYLRDQHWVKTLHAGVMGGAYVGMAGLLSLMVGGNITSNFINQKAHGCPFVGVALFRLGFVGPKGILSALGPYVRNQALGFEPGKIMHTGPYLGKVRFLGYLSAGLSGRAPSPLNGWYQKWGTRKPGNQHSTGCSMQMDVTMCPLLAGL